MKSIDYNAMYSQMRKRCAQQSKTAREWDSRAARMNRKDTDTLAYTHDLRKAIDITGCQTHFDVCCGVGHLLLALAEQMECAYGLDFSPVMLQTAKTNAKTAGIENVDLFLRAWENDWSDLPRADIVTASRCLDVDDMAEALHKLDALARKRVYISYRADDHHLSQDIIDALERSIPPRPDYILLVNMLHQWGKRPSLNYISTSDKASEYPTFESLRERVEWSLQALTEKETDRLQAFYSRLPQTETGIHIHTHPITWALISWEK